MSFFPLHRILTPRNVSRPRSGFKHFSITFGFTLLCSTQTRFFVQKHSQLYGVYSTELYIAIVFNSFHKVKGPQLKLWIFIKTVTLMTKVR